MKILKKRQFLSSIKRYPWLCRYDIGLEKGPRLIPTITKFFTIQCTVPNTVTLGSAQTVRPPENVLQNYYVIIPSAMFSMCAQKYG